MKKLIFLVMLLATMVGFGDDPLVTKVDDTGFRYKVSEIILDTDTVNKTSWQNKPTKTEVARAIKDSIVSALMFEPDTNDFGVSIFRFAAADSIVPDSIDAPGRVGTVIFTPMYLYFCVRENTWAATTLMPFPTRR